MSKHKNAQGRKKDRVFRLVYGLDFQKKCSEKTWGYSPSKFVLLPSPGVVFDGFVSADGVARRGFLLDAEDAVQLGVGLQHKGTAAPMQGDQQ